MSDILAARLDFELGRLVFPESQVPTYHLRIETPDAANWTWTPRHGLRAGSQGFPTAMIDIGARAAHGLVSGELRPGEAFAKQLLRVGGMGADILALANLWAPDEVVAEGNALRAKMAISTAAKRARVSQWRQRLARATGVDRIFAMLEAWVEHRTSRCILNMWTRLDLPGLDNRAWHDPTELPFAPLMDAAFDGLREEARRLVDGRIRAPHYGAQQDSPDEPTSGRPRGWRQWALYQFFERQDANCDGFPVAARVIDEIAKTHCVVHAGFLILEPNVHIPLHSDSANWCWSHHYGLLVPPGCHQTVAGEQRHHAERKALLFEDCFVHTALNESSEPRVVLNCVVANPSLSPAEHGAMRMLSTDLPRGALVYQR